MAYISNIPTVQILIELCHSFGIKHVILSSGSRNAPLIISFSGCGLFECLSITDERSAAYFALGLAKATCKPVAIVCTSGTAALNYAPAVAEAYYQKIPLIVITADRPARLTDQAEGQTIRQNGIYENFIRFQCSLPESEDKDNLLFTNRLISEALLKATGRPSGPVHINIPLNEPLYGTTDFIPGIARKINSFPEVKHLSDKTIKILLEEIDSYKKIMILVGENAPDKQFNKALSEMAQKGCVVITETLSNCNNTLFYENTDKILSTIKENEFEKFSPDLLITFDTQTLSRMIKKLLKSAKPKSHWHFTDSQTIVDTYNSLTQMINGEPSQVLSFLANKMKALDKNFYENWRKRACIATNNHNNFISNFPWCDLKVFKILSEITIPATFIHLGNSTPVRYAQLFNRKNKEKHQWFGNRGTSGIDGCVSTAAGFAYGTEESTLLITGDMSFIYDSNGLWNNYLQDSFRIIVINNGGGGIFRFLQGPDETNELEEFFETKQNARCEGIAQTFGLKYSGCYDEDTLLISLEKFFEKSSKPKLLEIFTPRVENGTILRNYFKMLKYEKRMEIPKNLP